MKSLSIGNMGVYDDDDSFFFVSINVYTRMRPCYRVIKSTCHEFAELIVTLMLSLPVATYTSSALCNLVRLFDAPARFEWAVSIMAPVCSLKSLAICIGIVFSRNPML